MVALRDILVWIYWHPFRRLIWKLPVPAAYRLGRFLGGLLSRVPNKRLAGMAEAARLVLPDAPLETRRALAQKALIEFCLNDLEVLLFPKLTPAITASLVTIQGRERLDAALARGRGVMLAFGHFGANQMIMPAIGHAGYRMCQLSAPATVLNEKLPEARRQSVLRTRELRWRHEQTLPVTHINVFGSLKEAFACLKSGHVLGVAMDGGGGEKRAAVPFLGHAAAFPLGPMLLAQKTGCAVLPAFMERGQDGRHTLIIEPPLPLVIPTPDGPTPDEAATTNTARFAAILTRRVLANPSHYLYFLSFRTAMAAAGEEPFVV